MSEHPDFPDTSSALPGTGPKVVPMIPKDAVAAAGDGLRRNLDVLIANQSALAKLRRAAYLALIEAGFNEKEALELCCK